MAAELGFEISDLRQRPEFADTAADRIWRAWWRDGGTPLDDIRGLVENNFSSTGIPFALVAHRGEVFLGTVSVIESDMDERPQYTPWVAAVWVDAEHRSSGIGSALVRTAAERAWKIGSDPVFLCATKEKAPFYLERGWQPVETDVGRLNIFSLSPGDHSG